jgi:two-component system, sensor histidine kinase and response regulator
VNAPPQTRVKVLLVDDLEENLVALAALFDVGGERDGDIEVLTARDGAAALELLLEHEVALALLDVQMPDMDGFELAELMRGSERTRRVPIIFVTAGARDLRRVFRGYESGAVDFLNKPIEPHILRSKADVFFQLHRQQQQLARELQHRTETLRMNEMFTAVLGHDLRNPLSAILTSAQVLQRISTEPQVQETAERMLSSGRRMNRLIEDILDLARSRLGTGIPLQRQPADLRALVERVVREHQTASPERRIEVRADGDLSASLDGERFAQVASNLLGNALKYGDVTQAIVVELDGGAADSALLRVSNAGRIAPESMPHLFDPFRRGQREAGRPDGLGLGLYIVEQIVKAHGGTVSVRSDEQGTVFTVALPRA